MLGDPHSLRRMATFGPSPDPAAAPGGGGTIFWGEMSPCEHLVQIYKDDGVFMDALDGFVYGGLTRGDGVVIIGTAPTRAALAHRLDSRGIDVAARAADEQYIALDAQETLDRFMRPLPGGEPWPDAELFAQVVNGLLMRASKGKDGTPGVRRVRAFGEMVAILWQQGHSGATVRLEHLWHELCQSKAFCLFCAYPRAYFTQSAEESIAEICLAHSRVVPG